MKDLIGWITCILYVAWDILRCPADDDDNPFPKP
jgi:hypothetical protein